jgi:hypothetical protein
VRQQYQAHLGILAKATIGVGKHWVSSRGGFNAGDRDDVPFGKEEAT